VVRETVGLVAYRAGEWAEAIGELRAARRMGGGPGHLAVLADCERALGHPEKAIELARSEQAGELEEDGRIELATVVAGARADLGQIDAGLAHLEQFDVRERSTHPRLAYAYADLLDRAGRQPEALTWFIRAANADVDEDTDALERVEALAATVYAETTDPVPDTAPIAPDAEPADSAATEPGPAEAGATEPGPAEAGATEPGAAEAGATVDNGAALDPGVEETETGESDPTEPVGDVSQVLFSDDQQ
jgi:tetratricopeptide (TPR) repeat protein